MLTLAGTEFRGPSRCWAASPNHTFLPAVGVILKFLFPYFGTALRSVEGRLLASAQGALQLGLMRETLEDAWIEPILDRTQPGSLRGDHPSCCAFCCSGPHGSRGPSPPCGTKGHISTVLPNRPSCSKVAPCPGASLGCGSVLPCNARASVSPSQLCRGSLGSPIPQCLSGGAGALLCRGPRLGWD